MPRKHSNHTDSGPSSSAAITFLCTEHLGERTLMARSCPVCLCSSRVVFMLRFTRAGLRSTFKHRRYGISASECSAFFCTFGSVCRLCSITSSRVARRHVFPLSIPAVREGVSDVFVDHGHQGSFIRRLEQVVVMSYVVLPTVPFIVVFLPFYYTCSFVAGFGLLALFLLCFFHLVYSCLVVGLHGWSS